MTLTKEEKALLISLVERAGIRVPDTGPEREQYDKLLAKLRPISNQQFADAFNKHLPFKMFTGAK